jgi:hypothetical protein
VTIDMDDHKIVELMKLRAEVKAELDKLDASIRLLRNWLEHCGKRRHYSAAARKAMSEAAKKRWAAKNK